MLILDDLLDISKIEANRMDLENTGFSLRSALYLTLKTISVTAIEKGLSLILVLDPALPDRVIGDMLRFRQVINNLLSNAVKFTDDGKVVLSLSLKDQDKETLIVDVIVMDTGIGIEKDKIGVIFDKFRQANESITRKYSLFPSLTNSCRFGGTGLGLSISKQLVLLMGGTLEASSKLGEGSIFRFDIPLERVHMRDNEVLEIMGPFRGRNILHLDVQHDKTGVAEMMRSLGLTVFVTHTLADATKTSDEQSFDIVVLDSFDQVRPVRAYVRLSGAAIILLTTSGTIKNLNESLAEPGISCIYTTPTTLVDLYPPLMAALLLNPTSQSDEMVFNVLLADDNLVNRKIVVKLLTGHQHKVDAVENGRDAFDAFVAKKYHIVLMVPFRLRSLIDREGCTDATDGRF
jgi:osomolarity two-component system, sensor histidine kinase NIK1